MIGLVQNERSRRFETLVMPHLDAAYNLAFWITRHEQDAQDVTQEAYMRALRYFDSFHGEDAKAWLLGVVRNTAYTWLGANRKHRSIPLDEELSVALPDAQAAAEADAFASATKESVDAAIRSLPEEYREVVVLRELDDLSYKEIAQITESPIGTVMSRLARARALLRGALGGEKNDARM